MGIGDEIGMGWVGTTGTVGGVPAVVWDSFHSSSRTCSNCLIDL